MLINWRKFTGKKSFMIFKDNGRPPILLVGLKSNEMQKIFDAHVDESASMSIKTQRKLRSEALTDFVENKKSLQKLKIFKDFEILFPSVSKEMGKKKNLKKWFTVNGKHHLEK